MLTWMNIVSYQQQAAGKENKHPTARERALHQPREVQFCPCLVSADLQTSNG